MRSSIDKVRERTRRSTDERRGSEESASGKRLSALIGRGSKRLKLKEKNTGNNTLSVHSGESGDLAVSDSSLLDDDGNSSLLTDDCSDNEGYVCEHLIALARRTHLLEAHTYIPPCASNAAQRSACQHASAARLRFEPGELSEPALARMFTL